MIINPHINQLYVVVDGHVFGRTSNMWLCIYINFSMCLYAFCWYYYYYIQPQLFCMGLEAARTLLPSKRKSLLDLLVFCRKVNPASLLCRRIKQLTLEIEL